MSTEYTSRLFIVVAAVFLLGSFSTCSYDNHIARQDKIETIRVLADAGTSEQGIDCITNRYGNSEVRRNACAGWTGKQHENY